MFVDNQVLFAQEVKTMIYTTSKLKEEYEK